MILYFVLWLLFGVTAVLTYPVMKLFRLEERSLKQVLRELDI